MCGIVGYVGPRPPLDVLMPGLERLEYRGYDSAGIALNTGSEIEIVKRAGRIAELSGALAGSDHRAAVSGIHSLVYWENI